MDKPIRVEHGEIHCSTIFMKPGWRRLDEEFTVTVIHASGKVWRHTMEVGFKWNGSSTPWLFRGLVPKFHNTLEASCLHDKLCADAWRDKDRDLREYADICFKLCIEFKDGLNWVQKWSGFAGVRLGAWWSQLRGKL